MSGREQMPAGGRRESRALWLACIAGILVFTLAVAVLIQFLIERLRIAPHRRPPTGRGAAAPFHLTISQLTDCPTPEGRCIAGGIDYSGRHIALESNAGATGAAPGSGSELYALAVGGGARQLTTGALNPNASWISGDGKMIAFIANGDLTGKNSDHSAEVFVASFDGKVLRQLTNTQAGPRAMLSTKVNHDGKWVAFMSTADLVGLNPGGQEALFVARSDGTRITQVAGANLGARMAGTSSYFVSPDGSRLAFSASGNPLGLNPDGSWEAFVVNRDGSGLRQVTRNPERGAGHQVSFGMTRDGSKILLRGNANPTGENPTGKLQIFVVNADGSGLRQLTHDRQYDSWLGTMSYDGKVISFRSQADFCGRNRDHSWEVFLMDGDGNHITQVSDCVGPAVEAVGVWDRLSGDGRWLAFSCGGNSCGRNYDCSVETFLAGVELKPPRPR